MPELRRSITFKPHRLGREIAVLGERIVGELNEEHGTRAPVRWRVSLTDWPMTGGRVHGVAAARRLIAEHVGEWLASMGMIDPGAGLRIVAQHDADADTDRRARA